MSMDDILRRFFFQVPFGFFGGGYREENPWGTPDGQHPLDDGDGDEDGDDIRWNSVDGTNPNDMFGRFDRHFEHIFKSFFGPYSEGGSLVLPPDSPLSLEEPKQDLSLRDRLLKRPEHDHRRDTDLDVAVSKQGLSAIDADELPRTSGRSFFSTTRITVQGADGKIEERLTKRDSAGNEETIVTRKLGEQTHRVVTRRDKIGVQEHQEDLVNMDENNLGEFNERWTSQAQPKNRHDGEMGDYSVQQFAPEIFGGDKTAPALFRKLFGSFLPSVKP